MSRFVLRCRTATWLSLPKRPGVYQVMPEYAVRRIGMRLGNALISADPDVRHPTATGTRIQITQFASAQGGALATKLPAITRASCTSKTLAWSRTVISLPCGQFLVGRRRSQQVPAQPGRARRWLSRAVAVMRRSGCR